ncbi:lysine--tRNA ligase [uncultured Sutterella sp.]|uniref:lysine--tRNA ligase n=1 Tax=uncultured Sutterella sp. TaxID=286133 RepID=UPI00259B7A18|nr:lysine--tRNA ligase [uncultured Sutterella sp.]
MTEQNFDVDRALDAELEHNVFTERRRKLAEIREQGVAYPNDFKRTALFGDLSEKFADATAEELERNPVSVAVSGRMMLKRVMGRASFATVRDFTGTMQYFVAEENVGEAAYAEFKTLDLGDIVAAKGTLMRTRMGELAVRVTEIRLMSKCLRPLPDKYKGLADTERCYRQRYVDLIVNEESRKRFLVRSRAIAAVRQYMIDSRFLEVETPMLHPIPGGANARPFVTHHNALDMDMYLRIAPELYLKRLVVGGFERVFEINRNFRNEGVSARHNPEFTMMEFYATYWTYRDLMDFTEALLRHVAAVAAGSPVLNYQGMTIDLSEPFDRLTPKDAILRYAPGYSVENLEDKEFLLRELERLGGEIPVDPGLGALQMALFDETVEKKLIKPTFIIDYPTEISPLARASDADHSITERFELFIVGRETANGFSELNDPDDQAERFRAQVEKKSHGDDEAMYYDSDYVRALEYGLPPTGGCGIGIDRFMMLLTNAPTIRDVLLFPHMRPETGKTAGA